MNAHLKNKLSCVDDRAMQGSLKRGLRRMATFLRVREFYPNVFQVEESEPQKNATCPKYYS